LISNRKSLSTVCLNHFFGEPCMLCLLAQGFLKWSELPLGGDFVRQGGEQNKGEIGWETTQRGQKRTTTTTNR